MPDLSHLDKHGNARMVDVGAKPVSTRTAIAKGQVRMLPQTLELIRKGAIKKGDIITVAQIAGITAAKRTADLIPFCHPLSLNHISIDLELDDQLPGVQITAKASTEGKTGVEMEVLTAVSVSALTIYDMAKAVEKTMHIENIRLVKKTGGQGGDVENK